MLVNLLGILGSELPLFEHINVVNLGQLLLQREVYALFHGLGWALPFREEVGFADVELFLELLQATLEDIVLTQLLLGIAGCGAIAA